MLKTGENCYSESSTRGLKKLPIFYPRSTFSCIFLDVDADFVAKVDYILEKKTQTNTLPYLSRSKVRLSMLMTSTAQFQILTVHLSGPLVDVPLALRLLMRIVHLVASNQSPPNSHPKMTRTSATMTPKTSMAMLSLANQLHLVRHKP